MALLDACPSNLRTNSGRVSQTVEKPNLWNFLGEYAALQSEPAQATPKSSNAPQLQQDTARDVNASPIL
jgi:hypothetical protein